LGRPYVQRGHVGEAYVAGSGIQNYVMGFILATVAMLELERSVPLDRDPHLKRKIDVTNLLADPIKIKQLGWERYNRRLNITI
jgi:GDP-D-mannose dehydratase